MNLRPEHSRPEYSTPKDSAPKDSALEKDIVFASKLGEFVSRFPDVWQTYQDWLGDIIASQSILLERYPTWQSVLIFRWHLLYFGVYVGSMIVLDQLVSSRYYVVKKSAGKGQRFSAAVSSVFVNQYRYILQRTATLLAVAELTLCGVAALTGVLMAFYYQPTTQGAHTSLAMIVNQVSNGALVLSLHNVAGNGLIVLALVQIVVMYLGREFLRSWFAGWLSGIFLTLTAIGLSWSAIVLNWEQTGFWRFKIELGTIASIPMVGPMLRDVLAGGGGISNLTVQHMYTLHSYVLAIAAILLSITHLAALICQEQTWKPEETRLSLARLCTQDAPRRDSPPV